MHRIEFDIVLSQYIRNNYDSQNDKKNCCQKNLLVAYEQVILLIL